MLATMMVVLLANTADDVLFEDTFKDGLPPKWQVVNLDKKDYRVRDGGLEMRVQAGERVKDVPMFKIVLPFKVGDSVTASVKVTLLDEFTADKEYAGMFLLTNGGREFAAKKERVDGKLVFSPGKYTKKKGEEGSNYEVTYTDATENAALRIILQRQIGFFQVGPLAKDEYKTFFHSELSDDAKERGFCLTAAGAPDKADHWVRFTNFKVVKH